MVIYIFWWRSHRTGTTLDGQASRSEKQPEKEKNNSKNIFAIQYWNKRQFSCHQIRISQILPWDRKSYLNHAILPRTSSYVIIWNCILTYSGTFGSSFKISKLSGEQEKESIIHVKNPSLGITTCHHLASWCQTAILGTDFSILPSNSW